MFKHTLCKVFRCILVVEQLYKVCVGFASHIYIFILLLICPLSIASSVQFVNSLKMLSQTHYSTYSALMFKCSVLQYFSKNTWMDLSFNKDPNTVCTMYCDTFCNTGTGFCSSQTTPGDFTD